MKIMNHGEPVNRHNKSLIGKSRIGRAALLALSLAVALTAWGSPSSAQSLLPRPPGIKHGLTDLRKMPASNKVVVKFQEGKRVRMSAGKLTGLPSADNAAVASVLATHRIAPSALRRLHARAEAELDQERADGERLSGQRLADLNLYYVIDQTWPAH
jgi:serine protease